MSQTGRLLPVRAQAINGNFQYLPDMPKHAGNVRFGRKKTFPRYVLMTGMPQFRTFFPAIAHQFYNRERPHQALGMRMPERRTSAG